MPVLSRGRESIVFLYQVISSVFNVSFDSEHEETESAPLGMGLTTLGEVPRHVSPSPERRSHECFEQSNDTWHLIRSNLICKKRGTYPRTVPATISAIKPGGKVGGCVWVWVVSLPLAMKNTSRGTRLACKHHISFQRSQNKTNASKAQ